MTQKYKIFDQTGLPVEIVAKAGEMGDAILISYFHHKTTAEELTHAANAVGVDWKVQAINVSFKRSVGR